MPVREVRVVLFLRHEPNVDLSVQEKSKHKLRGYLDLEPWENSSVARKSQLSDWVVLA